MIKPENQTLNFAVIDDDYLDIELLGRYLYEIFSSDYSLEKFSTWEEAEENLENCDLLFIDYYLGCRDAKEIIGYIKEKYPTLPIIVLTGRGDENIAVDVMKTGADDYMNKNELSAPFLKRTIEYTLSRRKMQKEQIRLEYALKQSQKLEALGTLAGGIAHDFNNMFAAVTGYLDLLKLRTEDSRSLKYLTALIQVTDNMSDLIKRLLTFSQGNFTDKIDVDITDIVKDVLMILEHTATKSVTIESTLPSEPQMIHCNKTMIQQTILNVCLNGIESMETGGNLNIECRKEIIDSNTETPGLEEGIYTVISVTDTGTGIDEEHQTRIFEPFFTTKSLGSKKGTGLGLALSWQSIKEHGGLISFSSELNKGSTFNIYLPVTEQSHAEESPEEPLPMSDRGETVLVVDDEKYVRDSLTEMLNYLGYNPVSVSSGIRCIEYIKNNRSGLPLIILDISMPVMSGIECISLIEDISPETRILICSGHNSYEITDKIAHRHISFIQKPVHINTLANEIRKLLDS